MFAFSTQHIVTTVHLRFHLLDVYRWNTYTHTHHHYQFEWQQLKIENIVLKIRLTDCGLFAPVIKMSWTTVTKNAQWNGKSLSFLHHSHRCHFNLFHIANIRYALAWNIQSVKLNRLLHSNVNQTKSNQNR